MSNTRLQRAAALVTPAPQSLSSAPPPPADDGRELAAELAQAFAHALEQYRLYYPDAESNPAQEAPAAALIERALNCAPDQVTWTDIERIARTDPDRARARWQEVRDAARSEVQTGHRAAGTLEIPGENCWNRARFLAVRDGLVEAWQPRNDLEIQLLDQMAQFETMRQSWLGMLVTETALRHVSLRKANKNERDYELPKLTSAQIIADATRMVETCQRLYVKALRTLMDLRRRPTLVVRSARQVNVGERQINVCPPP